MKSRILISAKSSVFLLAQSPYASAESTITLQETQLAVDSLALGKSTHFRMGKWGIGKPAAIFDASAEYSSKGRHGKLECWSREECGSLRCSFVGALIRPTQANPSSRKDYRFLCRQEAMLEA